MGAQSERIFKEVMELLNGNPEKVSITYERGTAFTACYCVVYKKLTFIVEISVYNGEPVGLFLNDIELNLDRDFKEIICDKVKEIWETRKNN